MATDSDMERRVVVAWRGCLGGGKAWDGDRRSAASKRRKAAMVELCKV
jgi:hypothetical protein